MEHFYLNRYLKDIALPLIIDILKEEGYSVVEENIKVWNKPFMLMTDVKISCDYVKYVLNGDVVVYTNNVPNKDYMIVNEGIAIIDNQDLRKMALKYKNYELYDMLSSY